MKSVKLKKDTEKDYVGFGSLNPGPLTYWGIFLTIELI